MKLPRPGVHLQQGAPLDAEREDEFPERVVDRLIDAPDRQVDEIGRHIQEQALEAQQTTGQRLGDILIARFGISRVELSSALLKQLADNERPGGAKADRSSGNRDLEAPLPVVPASVSEAIEQADERARGRNVDGDMEQRGRLGEVRLP